LLRNQYGKHFVDLPNWWSGGGAHGPAVYRLVCGSLGGGFREPFLVETTNEREGLDKIALGGEEWPLPLEQCLPFHGYQTRLRKKVKVK